MIALFNSLKADSASDEFTILARRGNDDSFKSFTVSAPNSYSACRDFDYSYEGWVRVSGASLKSKLRNY